jgi:hypothetical protein
MIHIAVESNDQCQVIIVKLIILRLLSLEFVMLSL